MRIQPRLPRINKDIAGPEARGPVLAPEELVFGSSDGAAALELYLASLARSTGADAFDVEPVEGAPVPTWTVRLRGESVDGRHGARYRSAAWDLIRGWERGSRPTWPPHADAEVADVLVDVTEKTVHRWRQPPAGPDELHLRPRNRPILPCNPPTLEGPPERLPGLHRGRQPRIPETDAEVAAALGHGLTEEDVRRWRRWPVDPATGRRAWRLPGRPVAPFRTPRPDSEPHS